ncbi:MAG TPA: hypothetical protein VKV17_05630 [Bryobacteraceae bacterium]|nr:hypothetical protein [Bryobacteraceae bacterium]
MHNPGMVSIWFLIGILLTAYGLIITAVGLFEYFAPPAATTVLANLHPGLWWGLLILVLGAFYCWRFQPRKTK